MIKKKTNNNKTHTTTTVCLVRPICFYLAKSIYTAILPFGLDQRFPLPQTSDFYRAGDWHAGCRRRRRRCVAGRRGRERWGPGPGPGPAPSAGSGLSRRSGTPRLRRPAPPPGARQRRLAGGSPNEPWQGRRDKGKKPPLFLLGS